MKPVVERVWDAIARRIGKPWVVTSATTIIGLVMMGVGLWLWAPDSISPYASENDRTLPAGMTGTVANTQWGDLRLYQTTGPLPTILLSLGTGMLSAFLTHVVTDAVARKHRTLEQQAFKQFFGANALSRLERGHVVIQAEQIETLLTDLLAERPPVKASVLEALNLPRQNRLYKARHWVNARDAEGAKVLREGFRSQGFPTPELHIMEHQDVDPFEHHKLAPYVISMGLGFNDATKRVALAIDPHEKHFGIRNDTPQGDAVIMRRGLTGHHFDDFLELVTIGSGDGLRYLFPIGWKLEHWTPRPTTTDYGLIVRYTATVDQRQQTRIVLAGFTEDGTLAAGRYLVNRWERLLELSRAAGRAKREAIAGDFVAVVAGPAGSRGTWTEDPCVFERLPIADRPRAGA